MIYGRIWLVVKPSVGIPLLLGSVATGAMITHIGILTHTTWYSSYLEGGIKAKHAAVSATATAAASPTAPQAATSDAPPGK